MKKTTIETALLQKGHEITKKGEEKDILIPSRITKSFQDILYNLMAQKEFRSSFLKFSEESPKIKLEIDKIVQSYITLCKIFDKRFILNRNLYSKTFEWFISETMIREFEAISSGFAIYLKDAPDEEFDCISVLPHGLFFAECKTGKKSLKQEINKFVFRDKELAADYSLFIVDRGNILEKDLNFNKEEIEKLGIRKIQIIKPLIGPNLEMFRVEINDRYFFICSTQNTKVKEIVRHVIRFSVMLKDQIWPPKGYKIEKISLNRK